MGVLDTLLTRIRTQLRYSEAVGIANAGLGRYLVEAVALLDSNVDGVIAEHYGGIVVPVNTPSPAATINAILAVGGTVVLQAGTYVLETALVMASGSKIVGAGSELTTLTNGWAPAGAAADTASNALITAVGTTSAAIVNTTLTGNHARDTRTITVGSATGISASTWLRMRGHNTPSTGDEIGMSDGADVTLVELVQISSVASLVLTLKAPLEQFHEGGIEIIKATPVVGATLRGVALRCPGSTIAVGLYASVATGIVIDDVRVEGFSRAAFDLENGVRDYSISRVLSLGEVNSIVYQVSTMCGQIRDVRCVSDGLYQHALGIPRGQLTWRNRCTDVQTTDCILRRGNVGIRTWGGKLLTFANIDIVDMNAAEAVARDPELLGSVVGVGVDQGCGFVSNPALAEFAQNLRFTNVNVHGCHGPTYDGDAIAQPLWYFHDTQYQECSNCSVTNDGSAPGTTINGIQYVSVGTVFSDCWGQVDHWLVKGCLRACTWNNSYTRVVFGSMHLNGGAGNGSITTIAMGWRSTGGAFTGPRIERLLIQSFGLRNYFEAGFVPDYQMMIGKYDTDDQGVYTDVVLADNQSGAAINVTEVVELVDLAAATGTRRVAAAAGATHRSVIACNQSDGTTGLMFVALGSGRLAVSSAAVNTGALLECNGAAKQAVANAAPAAYAACWRALTNKAAGSAGIVVAQRL